MFFILGSGRGGILQFRPVFFPNFPYKNVSHKNTFSYNILLKAALINKRRTISSSNIIFFMEFNILIKFFWQKHFSMKIIMRICVNYQRNYIFCREGGGGKYTFFPLIFCIFGVSLEYPNTYICMGIKLKQIFNIQFLEFRAVGDLSNHDHIFLYALLH